MHPPTSGIEAISSGQRVFFFPAGATLVPSTCGASGSKGAPLLELEALAAGRAGPAEAAWITADGLLAAVGSGGDCCVQDAPIPDASTTPSKAIR
jgi:hypothetical protein